MSKAARIVAVSAAAILAAFRLSAFTMEPMTALLAPTGARSVAAFRLKNDGNARIAVKLSALTRAVDADGVETNEGAANLFTIYPQRLLIEPGATMTVKVQWKGEAQLASERCFRFVAEQLPVTDVGDAQSSGIKVMLRYVASVYVGDAKLKPDLVAKVVGATGADGAAGFAIEVENRGARHLVVSEASLELKDSAGDKLSLSEAALAPLVGVNYLPAFPRRFFLPDERAVAGAQYEAELRYKGEF